MAKQSYIMKNIFRAKWCATHNLAPFAKLYMSLNAVLCNCYIDYRADISKNTHISHHGSGVVVNSLAVIGDNVTIAHGVTIGNRMPKDGMAPKIGNNCYIGSGAYVGGGITIGDNVSIGANAVVIKDVPSGYTAVGNPARLIPSKESEIV